MALKAEEARPISSHFLNFSFRKILRVKQMPFSDKTRNGIVRAGFIDNPRDT
jgi:hypothetical protein